MIQFDLLRDLARRELLDHLDKYAGTKLLVWDDGLTAPLDLIAKHSTLKERQVEKMVPLKPGRLPVDLGQYENVVFVTRPEVHLMEAVADNVKFEEHSHGTRAEFHIMFVPKRSLLCEMRLKEKEVYGSFTFLDELSLFWFPLDTDVISMENRQVFRDFHLNDDPTCLNQVAKGMLALQAVFGIIPRVIGKGHAARKVFEFMTQMRKELVVDEPQVISKIDTLIIIDRQIDLISPFLTQLTYEGLIDEMFSINYNTVKLPAEKFHAPDSSDSEEPNPFGMKVIHLNSQDELYSELRDKNFNAIGPSLSKKARAVSAQMDERHDAKTVQELRLFVDKIPKMKVLRQSLSIHTTIAELVKEATNEKRFLENLKVEQELINFQNADRPLEYLEDACCHDEDIVSVLRLVCLQNVVNSGVKPKVLESYRRLILQTYGYKHLLTLQNLDRLGLLSPQLQTSRNYPVLRKRLNLTRDDVDEQQPNDIAYVHSVYAPLSIRLVQNLAHPGWKTIKDVLDLLPGPTLEEAQKTSSNVKRIKPPGEDHQSTTLVLFVGGCTFAEIAALRYLSQREDSPTEYMVATTAIVNGDTFVKSLLTHVDDNLAPRFV